MTGLVLGCQFRPIIAGTGVWGSSPVEYYSNSVAHFQHQDSLGTERLRTTYNGGVEGTFTSLPFGDGLATTSGNDYDPYHFAGLDQDYSSDTGHAQFRQYAFASGRWMSPDPYSGSYDFSNPQSFNRYSYVLNNPLSMTDPTGQDGGSGAGFACTAAVSLGGDSIQSPTLDVQALLSLMWLCLNISLGRDSMDPWHPGPTLSPGTSMVSFMDRILRGHSGYLTPGASSGPAGVDRARTSALAGQPITGLLMLLITVGSSFRFGRFR